MTSVETGGRAEQAAAAFLADEGYDVLEMNYRRPHCEIDIVARFDNTIYFVEVKYRATDKNGAGLDYIDARKLQHMQRAAETWVRERRWNDEYVLAAIEVSGQEFTVDTFIDVMD
jgi:putative endonuclease